MQSATSTPDSFTLQSEMGEDLHVAILTDSNRRAYLALSIGGAR
jgi:hypothetical protein